MKIRHLWAGLLVGVSFWSAAAFAFCGGTIQFEAGKSSARLHGSVAGYGVCRYYFSARKGQVLTVTMGKHSRPMAFLYSPVEQELLDHTPFVLPQSGRYELRVAMTRNDARRFPQAQAFTMDIAIRGAQTASSVGDNPQGAVHVTRVDAQQVAIQRSGFAGSYSGDLPCLTCRGINTYLTLYNDGSYTLSQRFLFDRGENDPSRARQGHWMPYGAVAVLQPNDQHAPAVYLYIKERQAYLLPESQARAAHPVVNEGYRLTRQ